MERFDGPNGTKTQKVTRKAIAAAATGTPYPAVGEEGFQRIVAGTRHPILAVVDFPPLPPTVPRPLVDPVPLSPVSLMWRKKLTHTALDVLRWSAPPSPPRRVGCGFRTGGGCPSGTLS
ncbi:hypothetical protein RKD28_004475 [Streptomyces sp. SAI-229]